MLSLGFVLLFLVVLGINGQSDNFNGYRQYSVDNSFAPGKLRLSNDGKTEQLIPLAAFDQSKTAEITPNAQPLPSPCIGLRPETKLIHPNDKTKYIQCRDEFHYEVFACPNGGDYNEQTGLCNFVAPVIDPCVQEKPCLNDGQCSILNNSTFRCTCRGDWTGDRCEIPLNSCVQKPCGPNAECRSFQVTDFKQDYICVCNGRKEYGPNCQETVPNPCISGAEQFLPFAFSSRGYIQCDGELIYFQPCGPLLYWNQEEKHCDRKRMNHGGTKALLKKKLNNKKENNEGFINNENYVVLPTTVVTTTTTEQPVILPPRPPLEMEHSFAFVPARLSSRQSFRNEPLKPINNQLVQTTREEQIPEKQTQVFTAVDSNQMLVKQWPQKPAVVNNQAIPPTIVQPVSSVQIDRTQNWQQDVQPQIRTSFPDNSQNVQTESWSQGRGKNSFVETTTALPNVVRLQGWQSGNVREQEQFRPTQAPSWQTTQKLENQQQFPVQFLETTTLDSRGRFNPDLSNQQQWSTQIRGPIRPAIETQPLVRTDNVQSQQNIPQQASSFVNQQWTNQASPVNTQNIQIEPVQPQKVQGSLNIQSQSWTQGQGQNSFVETTTALPNVVRLQGWQSGNVREQDTVQSNQFNSQTFKPQSNPTVVFQSNQRPDSIPSQNSQDNTRVSQPWLQKPEAQQFVDSPSASHNTQFALNNKQQQPRMHGSQFLSTDELRAQTDTTFSVRPNTQVVGNQPQNFNGQTNLNTFEKQVTSNNGVPQAPTQNFNSWQVVRTNDPIQTNNQQTFEQRRVPQSVAAGSWSNRS